MKNLFGWVTLLVGVVLILAAFGACSDDEIGAGLICCILGIIVGYTGLRVLKS